MCRHTLENESVCVCLCVSVGWGGGGWVCGGGVSLCVCAWIFLPRFYFVLFCDFLFYKVCKYLLQNESRVPVWRALNKPCHGTYSSVLATRRRAYLKLNGHLGFLSFFSQLWSRHRWLGDVDHALSFLRRTSPWSPSFGFARVRPRQVSFTPSKFTLSCSSSVWCPQRVRTNCGW